MGRRKTEFYDGDIVRVKSHVPNYSDLKGYVAEIDGYDVYVRLSGKLIKFDHNELILVKSPYRQKNRSFY